MPRRDAPDEFGKVDGFEVELDVVAFDFGELQHFFHLGIEAQHLFLDDVCVAVKARIAFYFFIWNVILISSRIAKMRSAKRLFNIAEPNQITKK